MARAACQTVTQTLAKVRGDEALLERPFLVTIGLKKEPEIDSVTKLVQAIKSNVACF